MKPRWETAAAGNFLPLLSVNSGDNHNHSPADFYPYIKLPQGQVAGWSEFPDLNWLNLLQNGNKNPLRKVLYSFSACFSSLGRP